LYDAYIVVVALNFNKDCLWMV